jgi:hypothetical protein
MLRPLLLPLLPRQQLAGVLGAWPKCSKGQSRCCWTNCCLVAAAFWLNSALISLLLLLLLVVAVGVCCHRFWGLLRRSSLCQLH